MINNQQEGANASSAINIFEILNIFWARRLLILICALVLALAAYVKVSYFTPYTYSTSGILYVQNRNEVSKGQVEGIEDTVYGSDISTSRLMSSTYIEILTTRSFFTNVSNALGGAYSPGQIGGMMSIQPKNETELLQVNVTAGSAQGAFDVCNAILYQAPQMLSAVFEGGEIKVVEGAALPGGPNSKNTRRTVAMALLAGIAIGCAIAFVLDYFDVTVRRSDDVAKRYSVSVLGEISQ